jgi:hypothetical protein
MESGGLFDVGALRRNLVLAAVEMFSHSVTL